MVEDSACCLNPEQRCLVYKGFEINSGDSGGPLWQREGDVAKVVGVVSTGGYAPDVGEHEARLTTWLAQNDSLLGDAPVRPVELGEIIHGGAGADLLTGGGGDDTLHADSGADTLSGGAGDDLIYGNLETDSINGGAGADVLFGGQNNGLATTRNGGSARREGIETVSGGDGADLTKAIWAATIYTAMLATTAFTAGRMTTCFWAAVAPTGWMGIATMMSCPAVPAGTH